MCDQWQTIITSTPIRSLSHAPLTGGMLLIANTASLNTQTQALALNPPTCRPYITQPEQHCLSTEKISPDHTHTSEEMTEIYWESSLPLRMVSWHLLSYDRKLPVGN